MKVKAHIQIKHFKTAELEVNDLDFLAYVNANSQVVQYRSIAEVQETGDFPWWLTEYLEERTFTTGAMLVGIPLSPAGETQYVVDEAEVL